MTLQLKRFPEFGVELHIRRGVFTGEDLIRHYRSLGPADALRWIYYFDETVETSGIKVADIPELKRTIAAKRKELFGDSPPSSALVCGPSAKDFLEFWISLLAVGETPVPLPVLFPSIRAACEELGLPDAACAVLERALAAPPDENVEPDRSNPIRL
jgi:hypothetical protein